MSFSSRILPFYDSLSDGMFRRDAEGREVFYPAGLSSRGRMVPEADKARLRAGLRRMWIGYSLAMAPLLAFAPMLIPNLPAFIAVAAVGLAFIVAVTHLLVRGFPLLPAGAAVSMTEAMEKVHADPRRLIVMFIASLALAALNVSILFGPPSLSAGQPEWLRPVAWFGLAFFVAAALAWLRPALRLLSER